MTETAARTDPVRALYAMLELSKALSAEVDVDALVAAVEEKASPIVDAETTSIVLLEPEQQIDPGVIANVARSRSTVNTGSIHGQRRRCASNASASRRSTRTGRGWHCSRRC
jgi:hypothetical protein